MPEGSGTNNKSQSQQLQQEEEPIRDVQWHLDEMWSDRSRPVLLMTERLPTPIQLSSEIRESGISWIPALPALVPTIQVKFESTEGDEVITKFESYYSPDTEKTKVVPNEKKRPAEFASAAVYRYPVADLNMQKWSKRSPYSRPKIVTLQEHEPSNDLNLLKKAYLSMDAHVVDCGERDVPDSDPEDAIYKQKSPLGNTVLHLAASRENNGMVDKVTQHAPYLFISKNPNYDTALHLAARAGHASTIEKLLNAYFLIARRDTNYIIQSTEDNYSKKLRMDKKFVLDLMVMLSLALFRNEQGNTFLHEAFMVNSQNGAKIFQIFEAFEADFKNRVLELALFALNGKGESLLYLAIKVGCKDVVNRLLDICIQLNLVPKGKSPLFPPIINMDKGMLETIVSKRPTWIHLKDKVGRFPLHYAASVGYLEGVSYLVENCPSCTIKRDNDGCFPLHLASVGGHVKVVQELLKWYPDPTEMLNNEGQNILHAAAESGKYKVVSYIVQRPELEKIINQQDKNRDTPLHLATRNWHPIIVHALTWDKRVNLALLNHGHETALDIALDVAYDYPTLSQRLTWTALHSAGTPRNRMTVPSTDEPSSEQYKSRVETLIVVATLIITASFNAGLTVPGNMQNWKADKLNHQLFHWFIFLITVSMFGAISTTIILIWARLGDFRLALLALNFAKPLLGITLTSLSLAFVFGVYLVVSNPSWFAITFLVIGVLLVLMVLLLYILLWLPSASTFPIIRYISYYPFLMLARLAERHTDANRDTSNQFYGSEYEEEEAEYEAEDEEEKAKDEEEEAKDEAEDEEEEVEDEEEEAEDEEEVPEAEQES